jgi:ribosomal protein S18 acetylase RimI-like enzyme
MISEEIVIRSAHQGDVNTIVQFNAAMALETEQRRLDGARLREGTQTFLGSSHYGFYILAECHDGNSCKPIGQLMITYEWSDWWNGVFWWIQSVYVVPERRGAGVFRAMYEHVFAKANAESRVCGIRLYVEQDNQQAQTVYRRVGFTPSGYTIFERDFVLWREADQK